MTLPTNVVSGQTGAIADTNEAYTSINLLVAAHDPTTGRAVRVTRPLTTDRLVEVYNPEKAGGAGWSVIRYQSGARDITADVALPAGVEWVDATGARAILTREGAMVTLSFGGITGDSNGSGVVYTLPVGFRIGQLAVNATARAWQYDNFWALKGNLLANQYDHSVFLETTTGQWKHGVMLTWMTDDSALPVALPGATYSAAPA